MPGGSFLLDHLLALVVLVVHRKPCPQSNQVRLPLGKGIVFPKGVDPIPPADTHFPPLFNFSTSCPVTFLGAKIKWMTLIALDPSTPGIFAFAQIETHCIWFPTSPRSSIATLSSWSTLILPSVNIPRPTP